MSPKRQDARPQWLEDKNIRPFVLIRPENKIKNPGSFHNFDWFSQEPLLINPLATDEYDFVNQILKIDGLVFSDATLQTPRWVFYDCAVMPGLVTGFAIEQNAMPEEVKKILNPPPDLKWVPLSLFTVIPTIAKDTWMAHNFCSVNELLPPQFRWKGLGFLSKSFGLWYANIQFLHGVTQWMRPALKLHANYGQFQIVTAFTPIHSYSHSVTYGLQVDPSLWVSFFEKRFFDSRFEKEFKKTDLIVEPSSEISIRRLQRRIEEKEGPFFLSGNELLAKKLGEPLDLFTR